MFNRDEFILRLKEREEWDIIVIGGGATGLGIAVDGASRGFKTLLLEEYDFAKGTSSRSTKLVHGGVRYLAQLNVRLVYEALHERGLLLKNASHLVKKQSFIIPCYSLVDKLEYLAGLKIYDWLSGRLSLGTSRLLSAREIIERLPSVNEKNLKGGIEYFDARFDDARLALNLAQTAAEWGATVLNYCKVSGLIKKGGKVVGVTLKDLETGVEYSPGAKAVINATGVFVDDILKMDSPDNPAIVQPSQGIHLVVNSSFLQSDSAVMIPRTTDGRVLFAVPWQGHVLIGTTDTPLNQIRREPVALESEIDFIVENVAKYFKIPFSEKDIISVFAGLRPLVASPNKKMLTKEITRDHKLLISGSGLLTITGGKWTTYRRMAKHAVDEAIKLASLKTVPCKTAALPIHGCPAIKEEPLSLYGTDADAIKNMMEEEPSLKKKLVENFPYTEAEVVWAVRHEMARTIEDVLARRLRVLFLNAEAAIQAAPRVAHILQKELKKNEGWKEEQLNEFKALAKKYLIRNEQE